MRTNSGNFGQVSIPPGAPFGHTVTLNGKAHQYPGKVDGALRVVAILLPHPRFERQGIRLKDKTL